MRSKQAPDRILEPDPIYGSTLLSRFINKVMQSGKKSTAQAVIYKALEEIKTTTNKDPLAVFEMAIANVAPKMEVRPRRVGGASYQVPVEVRGDRKVALAIRWLIAGAKSKSSSSFHGFGKKLASEIIDASNNAGSAIKKKEDMQKVANANRAFAHFRG